MNPEPGPSRADGDLGAFVDGNRGDLVALAFLFSGDYSAAEDVVQDVFERLWRLDIGQIDNLGAYARTSVVRECTTQHRRLARGRKRHRALSGEFERRLRVEPDPFDRVQVVDLLGALTTRQRQAVVLRYYLDQTDDQIAATLGCAPATVRSVLSRALRHLRRTQSRPGSTAAGHLTLAPQPGDIHEH